MGLYLRAKCQVFRITLTSFRQGVVFPPPPPTNTKRTPKESTQARLKQLSLDTKQEFEFMYHLIDGERLLSVVVGVASVSADKPLDFHDTVFPVSASLFKV